MSGEIIRPLAPEIPGFPFEAPSKKITAEDDFDQFKLNSSKPPRIRHEGIKSSLDNTFPTSKRGTDRREDGKEEGKLPMDSAIHARDFAATV